MSLIGEGEFALIREHLETAVHISASWVGNHDVLARLTDVAVMQKDEAAIRQWQIGRTLYELGELACSQDDATLAHQSFTDALSAFDEMKASPDIARTHAALNALKS